MGRNYRLTPVTGAVTVGLFKIYLQIERQKLALVELATTYGREDPRVLAASRRLDKLVVELQRRMAG